MIPRYIRVVSVPKYNYIFYQVSASPIAASLAMQYTLQTTRNKDKTGLMRVLGILAQNIRGHPFEDAFLHSLVTGLAGMKDDFEAEDFCTAVFDEFFFTCINVDNVVRHLIRLLWWVHTKLPPARLETLLKVGLEDLISDKLVFVFLSRISHN